jgi:hypothetical protein
MNMELLSDRTPPFPRQVTSLLRLAVACLMGTACLACRAPHPDLAPPAPSQEIESTLYLIGDAGAPDPEGEPVLEALTRELAEDGSERLVVFLGDNAYPVGLPPSDVPYRAESERRLDALLDVFRETGVPGILIPGNHDWGEGGVAGRESVLRQEAFVIQRAPPSVSFLPGDGCPGPSVRDLGRHLRLVLLDTQWWFESEAIRGEASTGCNPGTESGVVAAVERILQESGDRRVVILAHHPMASGGVHASRGSAARHLFPIRDIHSDAWVPLPLLGSLYVLFRHFHPFIQDLSSGTYQQIREAFMPLLERYAPLMWASGHDHDLQVLRGSGAHVFVISGAGTYGRTRPVDRTSSTLFARSAGGFMEVEIMRDGRMRLAVLEVGSDGSAREVFSVWLEE